eukprot:6375844-Pyramimonas_sp.AAC.1
MARQGEEEAGPLAPRKRRAAIVEISSDDEEEGYAPQGPLPRSRGAWSVTWCDHCSISPRLKRFTHPKSAKRKPACCAT